MPGATRAPRSVRAAAAAVGEPWAEARVRAMVEPYVGGVLHPAAWDWTPGTTPLCCAAFSPRCFIIQKVRSATRACHRCRRRRPAPLPDGSPALASRGPQPTWMLWKCGRRRRRVPVASSRRRPAPTCSGPARGVCRQAPVFVVPPRPLLAIRASLRCCRMWPRSATPARSTGVAWCCHARRDCACRIATHFFPVGVGDFVVSVPCALAPSWSAASTLLPSMPGPFCALVPGVLRQPRPVWWSPALSVVVPSVPGASRSCLRSCCPGRALFFVPPLWPEA